MLRSELGLSNNRCNLWAKNVAYLRSKNAREVTLTFEQAAPNLARLCCKMRQRLIIFSSGIREIGEEEIGEEEGCGSVCLRQRYKPRLPLRRVARDIKKARVFVTAQAGDCFLDRTERGASPACLPSRASRVPKRGLACYPAELAGMGAGPGLAPSRFWRAHQGSDALRMSTS